MTYSDRIEPVLRPALDGETLLAASPLLSDPGTTEDLSMADELQNLFGGFIQRAVFGRGLAGSPESTAGQLFHAVESALTPTLAVTDTGIVILNLEARPRGDRLLKRWFGQVTQVVTLVHRVPRSNVRRAMPRPKGALRRGRFLILFKDGSGCALVCAPPSLVEPVVAAL